MSKSEKINISLWIICAVLCCMLLIMFMPVCVQASQTVQSNVLSIDYIGASNSVNCGLYIESNSIDIYQSPIQTNGSVSVMLMKDSQKISFPIGIKLTGTITLYYTSTNEKLKETKVNHTFDCLNKSFKQIIFENGDFKRSSGEYTIVVDLLYQQSAWSSSCNQIITINHRA